MRCRAAVFFGYLLAVAAACPFGHVASAAGPVVTRFESSAAPNGKRLVVVCAKESSAAASCGLDSQDTKAAEPVLSLEFLPLSADQPYLANVVSEAADAQVLDPKDVDGIAPTAADIAVLRQVGRNPSICLAEKDRADVLLACPTGRPFEDAVVIFIRGLCDRCDFKPIVVRKVN